jgi:catechol 2,3-dioxygenase-like lactoylglutathione lyase family enzyme
VTPAPFARIDHVVIAVRDLEGAASTYATMLGRAPSWRGTHPDYGTANVLFGLANCYLELLAVAGTPAHPVAESLAAYLERQPEGLFALALGSDDLAATAAHLRNAGLSPGPLTEGIAHDGTGAVRRWRSFPLARAATRGVSVFAIEHGDRAAITPAAPTADVGSVANAVDHVVLFSDDLTGALTLWRDTFGIPERWRRDFPERGTVNVGLRLGGVTLELVAPLAPGAGERGERAWGLAYEVENADAAVARLRSGAVPVSDARTGLAPGTRVCTVKWPDRVPTLLIEHRERGRGVPPPAQV